LVNFDNYNTNPYKFDYIFNLIFDEIMVTKAVTFTTDFLSRNSAGEKEPFLISFEIHTLFDDSNDIKLGSKMFNLSGFYVIYTLRPKFDMIGLNFKSRIHFNYIDANEILLEYRNKVYNLVLFVYRNYEDGKVYFILYNITVLQNRQVIRHEEMKHYSNNMRVNVALMYNNSLLILIYDYKKRLVLKSYNYNITAKMIAKLTDNIIINGQKIPLQLIEDDSIENNTYVINHPLIIDLNGQSHEMISVKIRDYISIQGNVINMKKPEGMIPPELDKLVTFMDFIYPKLDSDPNKKYIGNSDVKDKSKIKVIFNTRFLVGNFDDPNEFDLYLNSTMGKYTTILYTFKGENRFCKELMISEKHFYCLYTGYNKFYIKAKALNHNKEDLFKVEIQSIQKNFKMLNDSDERIIFISTFHHQHGVRIEVINKDTLKYEYVNLEPKDFGTSDLNFVSMNYDYDDDNQILTLIGYSNLGNELFVYTARLSFKPFKLEKLKTLKDSFSIDDIDVNITNVLCKSKM
jgi:hypothetical protein